MNTTMVLDGVSPRSLTERSIWMLFPISAALTSYSITLPKYQTLLNSCGVTDGQIIYLSAMFFLIFGLLQIPTGRFADRFGRKLSMTIGVIGMALGMLGYVLSDSLLDFALTQILFGSGKSFFYGADSALLKDLLVDARRGDTYGMVKGKIVGVCEFTNIIFFVIGGQIGLLGDRVPFIAALGVLLLAVMMVLLLQQPQKEIEAESKKGEGSEVISTQKLVKYCMTENRQILWLILAQAVIMSFNSIEFWFSLSLLKEYQVPYVGYGWILAFLSGIVGLAHWKAEWIEKRLNKPTFALILFLMFVGSAASGSGLMWLAALGLISMRLSYGVGLVLFNAHLIERAPTEIRASVLSVGGMFQNALQIAMLLAAGALIDWLGSATGAFLLLSVVIGVFASLLLLMKPRNV